jgi:hypothetical protein
VRRWIRQTQLTRLGAVVAMSMALVASGASGASTSFDKPNAIAVQGSDIWVTNNFSASVTEVSATSGAVLRTLSSTADDFDYPNAIATTNVATKAAKKTTAKTRVWVVSGPSNSVTELSGGGAFMRVMKAKSDGFDYPSAIAISHSRVWITNDLGQSVTELNAKTGKVIRVIKLKTGVLDYPVGVTANGQDVWVINGPGNSLVELDAATGALVRVIKKAAGNFDDPSDVVVAGSTVLVANGGSSSVSELSESNGSFIRLVDLRVNAKDSAASRIAVLGDDAWVTTANEVLEFSIARGTILLKLHSKSDHFDHALAIGASNSHLWVTNSNGDSITELRSPRGSPVRIIK